MTYVPDPVRYQQLTHGDPNGGVNCTAWGAAFRVDAHSKGAIKTTGTIVRAHTDEPKPDPESPGLNLGQVDNAVIDITHGQVDFDTRAQLRSLSRADVRWRVTDGRFCGLSVVRQVFVNRGFGGPSRFGGGHDVTIFTREAEPDVPILFDSLVPYLQRISWDAAFDAAEALTGGRIYAQFTRDLTPDYRAVIQPFAGDDRRRFRRFFLDDQGRIRGSERHTTRGLTSRCSAPRYHGPATKRNTGRYLVQLLEDPAGQGNKGWFINAAFAEELNP